MRLAEAQQASGNYGNASENLTQALTIVDRTGDGARRATILGALGSVQSVLSRTKADKEKRDALLAEADQNLRLGLTLATDLSAHGLAASILTSLGNHHAAAGRVDEALDAYEQSADAAMRAAAPSMAARALANEARVAVWAQRASVAETRARKAYDLVRDLPASHDKA